MPILILESYKWYQAPELPHSQCYLVLLDVSKQYWEAPQSGKCPLDEDENLSVQLWGGSLQTAQGVNVSWQPGKWMMGQMQCARWWVLTIMNGSNTRLVRGSRRNAVAWGLRSGKCLGLQQVTPGVNLPFSNRNTCKWPGATKEL